MPMHRRNKAANRETTYTSDRYGNQVVRCAGWWVAQRRRWRRRNQLALQMRRQQRRIAKGKRK